jgi:acyl dehydratase
MAITVVKVEDLESYVGKELGATDWFKIDQERINKFADATLDHQFIHVDPEQATPIFGSTIAHGFLTLSLTAGIGQDVALVVEGAKMGLNYGLDKVRFLSPVPVDSEIKIPVNFLLNQKSQWKLKELTNLHVLLRLCLCG